jgi:hypothetical protein
MGLLKMISFEARRTILEKLAKQLASSVSEFVREELRLRAQHGESAMNGRLAVEREERLEARLLEAAIEATE